MSFFKNLISSIKERSLLKSSYFRSKDFGILHEDIYKALDSVMSKSGEISSLVFAEHLSTLIEDLNDNEFIEFFENLHTKYDIDSENLLQASNIYSKNKTQKNLELISQASEPQWVELFKRLNTVSSPKSSISIKFLLYWFEINLGAIILFLLSNLLTAS